MKRTLLTLALLFIQTSYADNTYYHYTDKSFKNGFLVVERKTGKVFQVLGNKMYKLELHGSEYLLSNEWQPISKDGFIKGYFNEHNIKGRK